ncbi:MAG: hypothetical protein ACR2KT_13040, partial [Methylocella sp.]
EEIEIKALHKLYTALQLEIVNLLELLNRLHESPEHELLTLSHKNPQLVEEVAAHCAISGPTSAPSSRTQHDRCAERHAP